MTPRETRSGDGNKLRDRALILPLMGLALLMPPFGSVFQLDFKLAGIPFTLVYLFTVWAVLILCGWWLSRRLGEGAEAGNGQDADT